MGRMSREKGKAGERKHARQLSDALRWPFRRAQQYNGIGSGDIVGIPALRIESKYGARTNIPDAMLQAESDCRLGEIPMVISTRVSSRIRGEESIVSFRTADLPEVLPILIHYLHAEPPDGSERL